MIDNTINDAVTIAGGEGTLLANRYRIVRQLGRGGMGSVWLVEDTQLDNKPFAVKMLPSILVANKRAYRQLKDEALVAMRLVHPNIVQIRAFEENNGNPFLVMDYIDGQTLDDYLAEHTGTTGVPPVAGDIPESEVLRILRPIAAALDYAHGEGVVHRDVKPANVMIRKDGHPFIFDFGIAREIQETMTRVTGKLSSGTLLYMSPEQLNGALPKPAQDVYSFAAMVYECLKGEPPFVRGQIEHQILNNPPEPLPGGTQLVASVMAGLAKKPEDRPATCAAVLGRNVFSHKEHRNSGGARLLRPNTIRLRFCMTVAFFAAALLVIVGGAWWLIPRSVNWPSEEEAARAKAEWEQRERRGAETSDNGHTKVQLWEGGPYWADTNIGAEKPWESGCGFKWGDTVGLTSKDGDKGAKQSTLDLLNRSRNSTLRRYRCVTSDNVLVQKYDVAHVQWGGYWRMATTQELGGLRKKCVWTWSVMNGVKGYVVRGRGNYASASIFLPAGHYWSSVPSSRGGEACALGIGSPSSDGYDGYGSFSIPRRFVHSVRPVQDFTNSVTKSDKPLKERDDEKRKMQEIAKKALTEWEQRKCKGAVPADNGHTKVQLWESGPYWADTNIGAEKPWDYGYYFWWGDTVGYRRVNNAWIASNGSSSNFSFAVENTPTYQKNIASLKSEGRITKDNVLAPNHDAAQEHWGGMWRMPTIQELGDLRKKCDWTWTEMNGVNGYVVRGRGMYASFSIFLPAAGFGRLHVGSAGYYWSSVPNLENDENYNSWYLDFVSNGHNLGDDSRHYGQSVRPVQGFTK